RSSSTIRSLGCWSLRIARLPDCCPQATSGGRMEVGGVTRGRQTAYSPAGSLADGCSYGLWTFCRRRARPARRSDQRGQVFDGAPHVQEDQAQAGVLASQHGQHGFLADGHQDNVAGLTLDVDLVEHATAQFAGNALAEG